MPAPERGPGVSRLGTLLLSACGLGRSPVLPGTVASLATAGLLWVASAGGARVYAAAAALLVAGAWWATLRFGGAVSGEDGTRDPGWVVSDEVAGQALAGFGALPWVGDWRPLAASFVLFRLFDMLKPPPVSTLERLHGARGILYDDVAAGLLAGGLTLALGCAGVWPA